MTFDEALAAVTPALGTPRKMWRTEEWDGGYSAAIWYRGESAHTEGHISLTDEDGLVCMGALPPHGALDRIGAWILDTTIAADDPRAEGSVIADPVTAAKAALAFLAEEAS